ncbi:hypothetical protein DBR43_32655 [Pedobacter sp. KBW06]|uniref:FecR family protein n=1 Tax=Pedobacter sp. KBW06 TaxID=2153359 RepID=UPI000F5902BE|nr:FecR domain-containing protein [Pedobacter sp. KBW06]RQO64538.1 hypothetical protein DBR43_32655 [Pedobacter sp. KBW06]
MEQRINKTELLQFLNGQCSAEASLRINQFLETAAGQHLLDELLNEHLDFASEGEIDPDKLSEWKKEWSAKFSTVVEAVPATSDTINPGGKRIKLNVMLRYAAVLTTLILGVGIYSISNRKNKSAQPESLALVQKNPLGRRSTFSLADGTKVYLGPGSALSYSKDFSGNKREVILKGEAYFEVTKDSEKPFMIYTENLRTQVLGTTFKVSSFQGSPILVSVTSGKVRVDRLTDEEPQELAILNPGEQVSYNQHSGAQKSSFNIENVKNWKQGQLVFNGTPLLELTNQISRWYNVSINISSETLKQIPITVTLDGNMPVYQFLDGLSASFGFNYKVKDKVITIY